MKTDKQKKPKNTHSRHTKKSQSGFKQKPHKALLKHKNVLSKRFQKGFGVVSNLLTRTFLLSHDHILIIQGEHSLQQLTVSLRKRGYTVSDRASLVDALVQHLGKALETRATKIVAADSSAKGHCITIGININPLTYYVSVDKGPKYGSTEADAFRQFWSGKSELRHAGGEVRETLVWRGGHATQRVVDWILRKQLGCDGVLARRQRRQLHCQLRPLLGPGQDAQAWSAALADLNSALGDLGDRLAAIGSAAMPLGVTGLLGVAPAFRGVCAAPPTAGYRPLHECHLQLESSGKWPALLGPFRAMKTLFCIRLAQLMRTRLTRKQGAGRIVACRSGVLAEWRGHRFHLRLALPREAALARQQAGGGGGGGAELGGLLRADCAESRRLERELTLEPALAGALRGLSAQCPTHAECVRLCLRWLGCHLLLPMAVEPMAVELLCAHVTITEAPCSALRGFLLFLQLLATHDFQRQPLIVNLNDSLSQADRAQVEADFRRRRAQLPPMFIACPQDRADSVLTAARPDSLLLARLRRCAAAALALLERRLPEVGATADTLAAAFRPPPQSFDAVLHLALPPPLADRGLDNCLRRRGGDTDADGIGAPADADIGAGFHWVERLARRLAEAHGEEAHFLCDGLGGNAGIGVLLRRADSGQVDVAELARAWVATAGGLVTKVEVFRKQAPVERTSDA